MRKLLMSALLVTAVGAAVMMNTSSFFNDTETSIGNTFEAGSIDLKVGAFFTSLANGSSNISVQSLADDQALFNFTDLKPGDTGTGRFVVNATSNEYWACMDSQTTGDAENGLLDPEANAGDTTMLNGELDDYLTFAFWNDVNDNGVYDSGDVNLVGPWTPVIGSQFTIAGLADAGWLPLADASGVPGPSFFSSTPLTPGEDYSLGMMYCFGQIVYNSVADEISCEGAIDGNDAQSDSVTGTLRFYAVQGRNNQEFLCSSLEDEDDLNVVEVSTVSATLSPTGWLFYNDENDTVDNTLGSFVAGPATPPAGTGSVQFSVAGTQRRNLATYQFSGTPLADITTIKFNTYQPSSNPGSTNRAIYLNFNVDFDGSDTWQRRLVFVPSANGTVQQDSWQEWDAIDSGNALWSWSGFAANGNKWPDGNTNANRTWSDIVASFSGARIRVTDAHWGFRAGEPYNDGFTGNIDKFTFGVLGNNTVFDFEQ